MDFKKIDTAFFSMEMGLKDEIPAYAGGLGILAGDALKSCSDLQLPVAGITLLYKKGYFEQKLDDKGNQTEEEQNWDPSEELKRLNNTVTIQIRGEDVKIACRMYELEGVSGNKNPVLFLDTDLKENSDYFRRVCDKLYQGDHDVRISQEMILGIGGVKMLRSLGCDIKKYHMNEGHTSFLTLELYKQSKAADRKNEVRKKCVFTTHTPVPAGHDKFDEGQIREFAGEYIPDKSELDIFSDGTLNMTHLGLEFSAYINGVARKHSKVSKEMFPEYQIESITNGVHFLSWASDPLKKLFDEYIPEWKEDPFSLRAANNIPEEEIREAHTVSKNELIKEVKKRTGTQLDPEKFTIGFAKRFVKYKRPDLIFYDPERLKSIIDEKGPIQIIFSGKAHPGDEEGKGLIRKVFEIKDKLDKEKINIVFLENYGMNTAKLMTAGCDIWLNNPRRPHEASGTSGMKAAINGVPHFSSLDGWWLEGHVEDVTGWSIGLHPHDKNFDEDASPDDEAEDFYNKLKNKVLPMFYEDKKNWQKIMKNCISINGSFFNTHRMMEQYVNEAYLK